MEEQQREQGHVKWFSDAKGYGFIIRDTGGQAFVHFSDILTPGYKSLTNSQRVEYSIVETERGPHAIDVLPI